MKKSILPALLCVAMLCSQALHSQVFYEKGYFIDTNGVRNDCFIRNIIWLYNPDSFEFKDERGGKPGVKSAREVLEFGVGFYRYVSRQVMLDTSSDENDDFRISRKSEPEWKSDRLFLRVMVDGTASLYFYQNQSILRFFYSVNGEPTDQLIYKRYKHAEDDEVYFYYNESYKNQLFSKVNCRHVGINKFNSVNYSLASLKKLFSYYNECIVRGK